MFEWIERESPEITGGIITTPVCHVGMCELMDGETDDECWEHLKSREEIEVMKHNTFYGYGYRDYYTKNGTYANREIISHRKFSFSLYISPYFHILHENIIYYQYL